jgi:putative hydrolase of HD superfamily
MPENTTPASDDAAVAAFAFEMGILKNLPRTGWAHVGVSDPESIAEHSMRAAQLAGVLAAMEGADPARASYLSLWHDSQETRIGDIPHTAKKYMQVARNEEITADQTADLPDAVAKTVQEVVREYEAGATPEAVCARDADKLECLIQAVEYRAAGNQYTQGWIDSSTKALRTPSAQRIATAAQQVSPLAWRGR